MNLVPPQLLVLTKPYQILNASIHLSIALIRSASFSDLQHDGFVQKGRIQLKHRMSWMRAFEEVVGVSMYRLRKIVAADPVVKWQFKSFKS
jgi:hypothetical protein